MFFYQILLERNIPGHYLTYKSDLDLIIGQLAWVPIRSKLIFGIVIKKEANTGDLEIDKIKEIEKTFPYIFNSKALVFLKLFSRNTFNSQNLVTENLLQSFKLLTKKDLQVLQENFILTKNLNKPQKAHQIKEKKDQKIEFLLEKDIMLRIIYIIRSSLEDNKEQNNQEIIIIFPEKKFLEKVLFELKNELENNLDKKDFENLQINKFFGDASLESKKTLRSILTDFMIPDSNQKPLKIIFSTRAGIFLPFGNLRQIVLVDEANSMYIQDQNKLYYDARDAVYMLANSYKCDLSFLSTLPSIRLHNFYPDNLKKQFLSKDTLELQKALNLQISKRRHSVINKKLGQIVQIEV